MSDNWSFIEQDEDKICWWKLELPEGVDGETAQAECMCVWPEVREDGSIKFDYGTSYDDGYNYWEFEYCGTKKTLQEAKEAAESLMATFPLIKEPK
jgi:hypothetical protein